LRNWWAKWPRARGWGPSADHLPDRRAARPDHPRRRRTAFPGAVEPDPQCPSGDRATGQPGTIEVSAGEDEGEWWIRVGDTGPGLPPKAREHLFAAFQGGARKGGPALAWPSPPNWSAGTAAGWTLVRSDAEGTEFAIHLPKETTDPAA
jgi:hypothetical protein